MNGEVFDKLWRQYTDAPFTWPEEEEDQCIYAQHFATWAEVLCRGEANAPTHIGINQKMLLLTKKYFEWRAAVPKTHRDRIGERSHVCIFHIFEHSFHSLLVLELSLSPPMLFLPPPPAPPAPPAQPPDLLGITLGEVLGKE